jgi:predicted nucleic acid-binding protein
VETSVWNFLFAEDAPEHRAATERFFTHLSRHNAFISVVVAEEIAKTMGERREKLLREIRKREPDLLELTPEAVTLAEEYIRQDIIPSRYRNDALHLALASYHDMDAIVSLNFKHIVKYKTKLGIHAANIIMGYHTPMIVTPEELLDDVR